MEELFQEDFFTELLGAHHVFGANPLFSEVIPPIAPTSLTLDKENWRASDLVH